MKLVFDIGNTCTKVALFDGARMVDCSSIDRELMPANAVEAYVATLHRHYTVDSAIASVVGAMPDWETILPKGMEIRLFDARTALPFKVDYKTPHTLGADRLAAVLGARNRYPGEALAVIDAGTCITLDYLDREDTYRGGVIMPGIGMHLRAMNSFTARLPLLCFDYTEAPVMGQSTEECMLSGAVSSTLFALDGYINHLKDQSQVRVILTGGDGLWIKEHLKNACEYQSNLLMEGLASV